MSVIAFARLLRALAAGAGQPLFTVNDWATRLGDSAGAQAFLAQLRTEWQPINVPDAFCQEMMDYARNSLTWHVGWPHLWAHTLRVTGYALAFASEALVEPDHAFLLGIFHDLGKLEEITGGEMHEAIGARLLTEKVNGHFLPSEVTLLANVIAKKNRNGNPYAQVLYDADKLDKIGATGLLRRLSVDHHVESIPHALDVVAEDAADFPDMHFPTSRALAKSKLAFTRKFLARVRKTDEPTTL